jgi:hypothetical protein
MNIEAVTICVGYDDFLQAVAPFNIPHLNRWLIVTTPEDERTREVCRRFSLECMLTEEGTDENGSFIKGRLIERGLQHLSANGWRLHLDSDIVLPNRFSHLLESANLKKDTIYGVDRIMVRTYEDWQRLLTTGYLHSGHDYHCRVNVPEGFTIGTRWASQHTGWCPIGFFQLWHSNTDEWRGVRTKPYPQAHNTACRTDVQHSLQWDRRKRELIPEFFVVHIESENCPKGTNWNGRKTKRFGPEKNTAPLVLNSKKPQQTQS